MRSLYPSAAVREFLETFIADVSSSMASLEQSVAQGDVKQSIDDAHGLKNAFLNGAFADAAAFCSAIEASLKGGVGVHDQIPTLRAMTDTVIAALRAEPEMLDDSPAADAPGFRP